MPERTPVGFVGLVHVDWVIRSQVSSQRTKSLHLANVVLIWPEARHVKTFALLELFARGDDGLKQCLVIGIVK
jgi:hypothetical protein